MATLMTITVTFDDGSSLTTTEAHTMAAEMASALSDFFTGKKDEAIVTAIVLDFNAADALTMTIT